MLTLPDVVELLYRCFFFAFVAILFMIITYSKPVEFPENDGRLLSNVLKYDSLETEGFNTSVKTANGTKTYNELEYTIFQPLGYRIREATLIPSLDFIETPKCLTIFADWLAGSENQNESGTPPKVIPPDLEYNFTLFGYSHLLKEYRDERSGKKQASWYQSLVDSFIRTDVESVNNYLGEGRSIYYAMKAFSVSEKNGMVIGSKSPWVEAFALKLGASHITTVEYERITIEDDDRITYFHPLDIARNASNHIDKYDFIASFSSLEHSGLGRFGDVLDPFGDLKEAIKTFCLLKKNGLFFIALPTGHDTVHFNIHRVYGRVRYALFAAGFDILDVFYFNERMKLTTAMFEPKGSGSFFHPVFVLRKR